MPQSMLSQVFRSVNSTPMDFMNRHLPMINSLTTSLSSYFMSVSQIRKKTALMRWFKQMPEVTGIVNKVARDIVQDWHFEPVNPNESGRNKILKANFFAQQVRLTTTMHATVADGLITGEGFNWIGKFSERQLKSAIRKVAGNYYVEIKERNNFVNNVYKILELKEKKALEGIFQIDGIDNDLLRPRKLRSLPSSVTEVNHDQYDILDYTQNVAGKREEFSPREIIHFKFMELDGKPNGFTPLESLLVQLELLRQMWQNQLSLHKNGGSPDKVIIAKNIPMNSPSFQLLEQQLEKYRLVENKHGNWVFSGDIEIQDLSQMDTMQFKDQGLYITGVIAMQWQLPKSSIPYIVGGTNTKDDTGGNSERGYWRCVQYHQKIFAETFNTQFWIPFFGVRIVFDKTFKSQDLQEETWKQLKFNNINTVNNVLARTKKKLSTDKVLKLINGFEDSITEEDLEDMTDEDFMSPVATGMGTSSQPSPDNVGSSIDKVNISAQKKGEQEASAQSRGSKPSGR